VLSPRTELLERREGETLRLVERLELLDERRDAPQLTGAERELALQRVGHAGAGDGLGVSGVNLSTGKVLLKPRAARDWAIDCAVSLVPPGMKFAPIIAVATPRSVLLASEPSALMPVSAVMPSLSVETAR